MGRVERKEAACTHGKESGRRAPEPYRERRKRATEAIVPMSWATSSGVLARSRERV